MQKGSRKAKFTGYRRTAEAWAWPTHLLCLGPQGSRVKGQAGPEGSVPTRTGLSLSPSPDSMA